ncbi:MAG: FG-GAP repeat protein [Candidatus Omnitrophica bacterium]|nr:FG-GAP repeat protein [Candidatus Omnitrophota bacterium]
MSFTGINGKKNRLSSVRLLLVFALSLYAVWGYCLPQGEKVVSGSARFDRSGEQLSITTPSDRLIVNYQDFSIGKTEQVSFHQPSSGAIALNRVVGESPSAILGRLSANGKVFLVNPNGVLFGPDSRVDVAGLVASTLAVRDEDFLAGRYHFSGQGSETAILTNQGQIEIQAQGYACLLSPSIENQGVIQAPLGTIVLAAGEKMTLALDEQNDISVVIADPVMTEHIHSVVDRGSMLENSGVLAADGGKVVLTAKGFNEVLDYSINNSGIIQADSWENHDGIVELIASEGTVVNTGTISAGQVHLNITAPYFFNAGDMFVEDLNSWWECAQTLLFWQEYVPSLQAEGESERWHLVNRAQNLRAYIDDQGWILQSRDQSGSAWQWEYVFVGVGKEDGEFLVYPDLTGDSVSPQLNKIVRDHGDVREWYVNGPEGIEQGFTVMNEPQGEGMLVIKGLVETDLSVSFSSSQEVTFTADDHTSGFTYRDLKVYDALGNVLPSRMEITQEEGKMYLSFFIDDSTAVYPLKIDPVSASPDWMVAEANMIGDWFGFACESAGDVNADGYSDVLVGAAGWDNGEAGEGAAYLYYGSAGGLSAVSDWMVEGDSVDANLGWVVATAGDVNGDGFSDVVIGLPGYENGEAIEGAVWGFYGSAGGLGSSPNWAIESNWANSLLGTDAATAGDVNGDGYSDVIVGAYAYSNGEANEGAAYLYYGSASGLSLVPDWQAESNVAGAWYGYWTRTAGDVNGDGFSDVIVTAPQYSNGEANEGAAYIYYGSAGGLPGVADWQVEANVANVILGAGAGTAGDVNGDGYSDVIVAVPKYTNGQANEGAAYVYYGSALGVSAVPDWTVESDQADAWMGYYATATAGDVDGDGYSDVIVGAPFYDNGENDEGRVFLYQGSSTGLSFTADWTGESDVVDAYFGHHVATAGDINGDGFSDVVIGAPFSTFTNPAGGIGRAYLYYGSSSTLSLSPDWTHQTGQAGDWFGFTCESAGDVNADGYSDIIVGAGSYDNGELDEGAAFAYYGSASGLPGVPDWTTEGNLASADYGWAVSTAGDVNGDGYSDVIVGADTYANGQVNEGKIFVYYGDPAGLSLVPDWTYESNYANAYLGVDIGTAGDVNNDGYSDVMVGAYAYSNGEVNEGAAFSFYGSASGLSLVPNWQTESNQANAWYGYFVDTAGDVNGDGYSDVIVSAPLYDNGENDEGMTFLYQGGSSGLSSVADWTGESNQANAHFSTPASFAGDVNGDGYSDVIIAAPDFTNGQVQEGQVYVYYGSAAGLAPAPVWTVESDQANARMGYYAVNTAGDVNGDGYSDVIVGVPFYDNGQNNEGRAYVYYGSAGGISASPDWIEEIDIADAYFGHHVACAGDINGDNYSDIIVGAPFSTFSNPAGPAGRVYVYYGNDEGGLPVTPRQFKTNGTPLPILGNTGNDGFMLQLFARTPMGRTKVKLQWEVKPWGTDFDMTGVGESPQWIDIGTAGKTLTQKVSGLQEDTSYHWRVRVQYFPFMSYSPWYSVGNYGDIQADFVTGILPETTSISGVSDLAHSLIIRFVYPYLERLRLFQVNPFELVASDELKGPFFLYDPEVEIEGFAKLDKTNDEVEREKEHAHKKRNIYR